MNRTDCLYRVTTERPIEAHLCDDLGQAGVAHHQPAAGGDAVRLVLELLRLHLVKVFKSDPV